MERQGKPALQNFQIIKTWICTCEDRKNQNFEKFADD